MSNGFNETFTFAGPGPVEQTRGGGGEGGEAAVKVGGRTQAPPTQTRAPGQEYTTSLS